MRRRLLAAAAVLSLFATVARAQSRGAIDWIFLVDTSASMRGAGGTKDIFDDVKASIGTFVRESNDGDSVTIFTFDRDVRLQSVTTIGGTARDDLRTIVDGLAANGNRTHLGLAIAKGLERAAAARRDPKRVQAVVLFTDGKEDVRGIRASVPILSTVRQVDGSHVFFVSMGDHEPLLDTFASMTPRTKVLRAPSRDAIREVADEIRKILKPPPPPAPPLRVSVSPKSLAFGAIELGETSVEQRLTITANRPAHVRVRVTASEGITLRGPSEIDLGPGKPATIPLQVMVAEDAPPGRRELTITAYHAKAVASLEVVKPSVLIRVAKIAIPIAILLAIAFILFAAQRRKNRLEGELEILQPRLASDAAYVGLPQLRANEIALSTIVPLDALAGSDARLFARRRNGEKKVWISAQSGSLRVNDVETPMSELYDADTIDIGAAKLRFNRAGHERTPENPGEDL